MGRQLVQDSDRVFAAESAIATSCFAIVIQQYFGLHHKTKARRSLLSALIQDCFNIILHLIKFLALLEEQLFQLHVVPSPSPSPMPAPLPNPSSQCVVPSSGKRCEYVGEFFSPDPNVTTKTCAYKCKSYGALATFPWSKDQPCPPSFDGNFPGP